MDPTIFNTPTATNAAMAATFRTTSSQGSPLISRFGGNGIATFAGAPNMVPGMVDLGFQGATVGDGTIHVACITQAGPEMLVRSQNAAYIAASHQIESLSRQIQNLEGQLAGQKLALAEVLSKVPVLLGITRTEGAVNGEPPSQPARCACTGKAVLGLGLEYPTVPISRPPAMTYWTKDDYSGRPAKGGRKAGQHKNDKNIGQIWIEDENGQAIEGYVAAQIRDMLTACFHSLVWSGQATSQSREFAHEARVFIHTALGRHFPFLVLCQGGQWKINELIVQNYPSFAKTHLSKKKTKSSKCRRADSNAGEDTTGGIDAPPAKTPKVSEHASHGSPVLSSSSSPTTHHSSHPLLEPGADLFVFDHLPHTHSPSPSPVNLPRANSPHDEVPFAPALSLLSLSSPPSSASTTPAPVAQDATAGAVDFRNPTGAEMHVVQEIAGGQPEARTGSSQAPTSRLSIPSTSTNVLDMSVANCSAPASTTSTASLPQIPVSKPFTVTIRCTRQTEIQASATAPVVTNSVMPPLFTEEAPASPATLHQQPASDPQPQAGDVTSADTTVPAANVPASNATATPATSLSSRRRGPPPAKASTKYKPETISMQSFHMRDRIAEDPNVTYTECQDLFRQLSPEQLQVYQDEVATAKKERNIQKKNAV